jgi:hypothetical protein
MTNETYPTVPTDYSRDLVLAKIEGERFIFLGQAIEWIISRDQPNTSAVIAERWDAAERELFALLDAGLVDVQGYRAPNYPRVYETLPQGIWARMNKGEGDDPTFSPVDGSEEREDGASVFVGEQRWDGVRIPTSIVVENWPSSGMAIKQQKAKGRRPRYDWKTFEAVASAKLAFEGAFDPSVDTKWTKAELERYMAGWCLETWGTEPSESTIRAKLSPIEAAYLEGRKG